MTHILLQISIGFVRSHNNVQTPLLWHSSNLKRGLIMHYQLHEIITLAIAQAHTPETLEQLLPNTTRNPIKGSYTHSCWKFFEISKTMYFGTKIEPSTTPHPTKKGLFHPFSSTCSLSTTFLSTSLLPHATYRHEPRCSYHAYNPSFSKYTIAILLLQHYQLKKT